MSGYWGPAEDWSESGTPEEFAAERESMVPNPLPKRPIDEHSIVHRVNKPEEYDIAEEQRLPISERAWNKSKSQDVIEIEAAKKFISEIGLPLVPDAIAQLTEAFIPALNKICRRGYHPEGHTWREAGWRGVMTDIMKKSRRLWYRGWINGNFDADSAEDLINFAGFYVRLKNQGEPWGIWGEPGGTAYDHEADRG